MQRPDVTFSDTLYVLHHVLRCGPGFGRWAACLIQPPLPTPDNYAAAANSPNWDPYDHPALHEILVILSIITSPIRGREGFIRELLSPLQIQQSANSHQAADAWVLVDSDGEDEVPGSSSSYMKENDLVSILNQIPIAGNTPNFTRRIKGTDYVAHSSLASKQKRSLCAKGQPRYVRIEIRNANHDNNSNLLFSLDL